MKVLTHRPRYIEPVVILEFGEGASPAAERKENVPTTQSTEEPAAIPKVLTVGLVATEVDKAEGPETEEIIKMPEILSPPTEVTVPKVQKGSVVTPKRRRMANVLDVVLETTKTLSPAPIRKVVEAAKVRLEADPKQAEIKAATIQAETEVGPSVPTEMERVVPKKKSTERIATEKIEAPGPEALNKVLTILFVMLRERYYPKKRC
jgi:hypothetical protein